MENALAVGQAVLELLERHGFSAERDRLARELSSLESADPQVRAAAQREIISMCHPRWLGDLYIEGLSLTEWSRKLDMLSKAVQGKRGRSE